jgi:dihydroxyacetone kinase
LHAALEQGIARMQEYGGARIGDRTMLDAWVPAIEALRTGDVVAAARAASEGAARTATMTRAGAGRSSYVREEVLRDVPDPGAVAVAEVFAALARGTSR